MGNKQSSTLTETNKVFTENLTNIISKNISDSSASCVNNQVNSIKFGPTSVIKNCPITMKNEAVITCNLTSFFNSNTTQQLSDMISQAVDNTASSSNKSVQDFLATSVSDQSNSTSIVNDIKSTISKNITNENISSCSAQMASVQNNILEIDGSYECPCTPSSNGYLCPNGISQGNSINASMLAQCLSKNVSDILTENKETADLINKAKNENSSEQSGLGNVIKAFISAYLYIIIAVIIGIVVIGFFMFKIMLSPAGQESIKTLSGKVASKI
jgi:hypothetical protein